MAILKTGGGIGAMSGRVGNVVYANTDSGIVVREMPRRHGQISERQQARVDALVRAGQLWRELTFEQAEAWRAYSLGLAARNPNTGLLRVPRAVNVFVGLAAKYMQIHGGWEAPTDPPSGKFLGDGVGVAIAAGPGEIVFTGDSVNRPGVLTELLAQRLPAPNNRPQPTGYKTMGFVAYAGSGDAFHAPVVLAGVYACAMRYVEAATGRATALVELGRVTVD